MESHYSIGRGKADITAYKQGAGMLGYGMYFNVMEGIETPLYARAISIEDTEGGKLVYVNCELCFITISLKRGVLKRLKQEHPDWGYTNQNVILTAQHTHSGPGGYSHYGLYNFSIPGFIPQVYEKIVDGIVSAIEQAEGSKQKASISIGEASFPNDIPIAFNRSVEAYNANTDVKEKISDTTRHLGVNRQMRLLSFTSADGQPLASLNWFGVHTTSLSNSNKKLCSDNKGFAATYLEEQLGKDYLGVFAQGICGDVTPKFRYDKTRPAPRGKFAGIFDDDLQSAQESGKLQYEKAIEILNSEQRSLSGGVKSSVRYFDFSEIVCDPAYTNGKEGCHTSEACLGMSFLEGAVIDGPGTIKAVGHLGRLVAAFVRAGDYVMAKIAPKAYRLKRLKKYRAQGRKAIVIESVEQRILGTKNIKNMVLPGFVDGNIETMKRYHREQAFSSNPLTPQILPLQLNKIGDVLIASFPFEITVVAARRLEASLKELFDGQGISEVILSPYANAYSGYITTYEEYQVQDYEGGHTVFGEWSLAALQTCFKQMAGELINNDWKPKQDDLKPPTFDKEQLQKTAFYKRNWKNPIYAKAKAS